MLTVAPGSAIPRIRGLPLPGEAGSVAFRTGGPGGVRSPATTLGAGASGCARFLQPFLGFCAFARHFLWAFEPAWAPSAADSLVGLSAESARIPLHAKVRRVAAASRRFFLPGLIG